MVRAFCILFSVFIWYSSKNFKKYKIRKVPVFFRFFKTYSGFSGVLAKNCKKISKVFFIYSFSEKFISFHVKNRKQDEKA